MKKNLSEEIRNLFALARRWLDVNIEYYKITAAEKISIGGALFIAGILGLVLCAISFVLLSMALVEVFKDIVSPALAYCCVAGIYILLMVVILLLRNKIFGNLIARMVSKSLLQKRQKLS